MFAKVELTAQTRALLKKLEGRWTQQGIFTATLDEFGRQSSLAAAAVQRGMAGEFIAARTGALRRSVIGRAEQTRLGPGLRVGILSGPALAYAGIQEYGTRGKAPDSPYPTIVPKRAKALTIPTDRAKTGAGVARGAGVSARTWPEELVFIPFRKGNIVGGLFVKREVSEGVRGGAVFLLATQVDLPARRYLRTGFGKYLPELSAELNKAIARWLAGTN